MLPVSMPKIQIVARVPHGKSMTVQSLCRDAGIECRVTGPAAKRIVYLRPNKTKTIEAAREPGAYGRISLGLPEKSSTKQDIKRRAILALGILAYAIFDYAARESMRGRPEARMALPIGRPRKAQPLSGAERQRRWRDAHNADGSKARSEN